MEVETARGKDTAEETWQWLDFPTSPALTPALLAWEEGRGISLKQSERDCRPTQRTSPAWPELGGCRLASTSQTVAGVAPAREQREGKGLERGWDHAMGVPEAMSRRARPAGMTLTYFKVRC